MPYIIYTYEDPYKLNQTEFWREISDLPHFCVSQTLINGFRSVMRDDIHGLICPLDNFVNHKAVYSAWTQNISRRIRQFSIVTSWIKKLEQNKEIDRAFCMSLTQNQSYFLEAIRLFIELGIAADSLDASRGNREQKLFVRAMTELSTMEQFLFPPTPSIGQLNEIFVSLAQQELEKSRSADKPWYQAALDHTKRPRAFSRIVVHGVHQFSPAQIRLLTELEKQGITIIFLFNYQARFSKMYASWLDIYRCFDVVIKHDRNVKEFRMDTKQTPGNALACTLGTLFEGRYQPNDPQLRRWYGLYKDIPFIAFSNITEYAHFVSNHFDAAKNRLYRSKSIIERSEGTVDSADALRFMQEQVYTANRDIHMLLKIYYPELTKERHFLSYPIGQFFSAIYKLWDYERGEIKLETNAVKECLASNLLSSEHGEKLLRIFCNVQPIFESIHTFSEFEVLFSRQYTRLYDQVKESKKGDDLYPLRQLSLYNRYKVSRSDIKLLVRAVEEMNEIAKALFATERPHEDYIRFGNHFQHLEEFLKHRNLSMATEEERSLINALKIRLEDIHAAKTDFAGTFRDLQEGIYYYLRQKEDDKNVDWIVRNFEQIDGDILRSREQANSDEEKKTYHFACLSDRDMNRTVDDLLPWPLTEEYLCSAYDPMDLSFQVYYTALENRSSFLLYALFYGLCFNYCDTRLSYVKQYGNETTEPYSLFTLFGFHPGNRYLEEMEKPHPFTIHIEQPPLQPVRYDRHQLMDMFLCPCRYFLDYVISDQPIVQDPFLFQKYYENILIEQVWRQIAGQPKVTMINNMDRIVADQAKKIEDFFPFWKSTELLDLRDRAKNYLNHYVVKQSKGAAIRPFDENHMKIRRLFGKARFDIEIGAHEPRSPYEAFENLTESKDGKKVYSLHRIPQKGEACSSLLHAMARFVNETGTMEKTAVSSDWCAFCVHRGNCMEPFLNEK